MRTAVALITALLLVASAPAVVAGAVSAPIPAMTQEPVQDPASGLAGSREELAQALAEPSAVTYKILVAEGVGGEDRTAHLDRVLDAWGLPGAETLLLVVYPEANHDIRFAMGASFRRSRVGVDEMVDYLQTHYFPLIRKGDPAGALANLIRAVNRRMDPDRKPLAWLTVTARDASGAGTAYDREPQPPTYRMEHRETRSLAEAREYLGRNVALPPQLEGRQLLLHRTYDEAGRLVATGLAETEIGFSARYRPAGDHRVVAAYDGELTTELRKIGGRPAMIVTTRYAGGSKGLVEVWREEGNWVYVIRGYLRDVDQVMKLAESLG